jgi:hypothetical protein
MFPCGRRGEWGGDAAKNSVLSGGGRLRNGGHDRETRKNAGASRIRFRESSFGRDGAASAVPGQSGSSSPAMMITGWKNPGREKALAAAEAVAGVAIFPNLRAGQRNQRLTDFNDLETLTPEVVSRQLDEVL